jgi:hypothetical protein
MHGGICKGVLKVGPGEAQKGLNSEAQKNAQRHCEAQFQEDFRLHLAKFWRSLGTFFGGCLWSEFEPKRFENSKGPKGHVLPRDERHPRYFAYLQGRPRAPAAAVRPKSEAQK